MKTMIATELKQYRSTLVYLFLAGFVPVLLFLYFFGAISRADSDPDAAAFLDYHLVVNLSLTVTLGVLSVTGAVVFARSVIADYVGDRRIALYMYPYGRSPLFTAKTLAALIAMGMAAVGTVAGIIVFILAQQAWAVIPDMPLAEALVYAFGASVSTAILSLALTVLSGCIGMWWRSPLGCLITGVILVCICGNSVGMSSSSSLGVSWLTTGVAVVLALVGVFVIRRRTDTDDIL